jgi:hypothetical protein
MSEEDRELLRLLDEAVSRLTHRRLTFTDEEALRPIWDEGYDIAPQGDPLARFALAAEADGKHRRQWRLHTQTLANNRLLDALTSSEWDGRDMETALARLDTEDQVRYIFCPTDHRFSILPDGTVEPTASERNVALSSSVQAELDALGPTLLQKWNDEGASPLTLRQITEQLGALGWLKASERNGWLIVRAWLNRWSRVSRVGQDAWIPADAVPAAPTRSHLQVLPVSSSPDSTASDSESLEAEDTEAKIILNEASSPELPHASLAENNLVNQANSVNPRPVRWSQPLRTLHVLEGFIPVPPQARSMYPPRAIGESEKQALRGLWFDSDQQMWLWLDRRQDRLYGPDLANQLEWLEAGDLLRIDWKLESIIIRRSGHDDEIQREEMRLVDPDVLKALRGGLGESYRQSLQAILTAAPDGLTFAQVTAAIRERQGHDVHRGTVRTLLYAGGFIHHDGRWFAAPQNMEGARKLRAALSEAMVQNKPSEPITNLERHHQKIQAIRSRLAQVIQELRG